MQQYISLVFSVVLDADKHIIDTKPSSKPKTWISTLIKREKTKTATLIFQPNSLDQLEIKKENN